MLGAPAWAEEPGADLLRLEVLRGTSVTTVGELVGGGPAIVSAWATYCPPCRAEAPTIDRERAHWPTVRFLAILMDAPDATTVDQVRREWQVGVDLVGVPGGAENALHHLLPQGLPATFVVHDGRVDRVDKYVTETDLTDLVEPIVRAQPSPKGAPDADDTPHRAPLHGNGRGP